ncbi:MAG: M56 family metallopeptidase [Terracidiphilus sp.]
MNFAAAAGASSLISFLIVGWLSSAFHAFAQWAAPVAVAALWQGAAVAVGLAVCLRLASRVSATHRFAAWAAGFGVVACLPALPLLARLVAGFAGGAAESAPAAATSASHPWLQFDVRWSLAIAGLWLALSAYRAAGLVIHSFRLRRLWRSAKPVEDGFASSIASALLEERSKAGRSKVEICTTGELDRPSVIGFFAPRILIPDWLLGRLTREELEQVILHESEHLRRCDDWTNLIQKLCLVVFPLNPALAWMERRLSREREMACDEGVVRVTGAPRAYAACLASLAERGLENNAANMLARRAEALSLGAFERRPELVHRVHSILFGQKMLRPLAGRALLGVVGCGLLFGSVELARCPQMVAFVPTRSAASFTAMAAEAEAPRALPASYAMARESDGFRAIDAEAIVPSRAQRATMAGAMRQPEAGRLRSISFETANVEAASAEAAQARSEKSTDPAATAAHEELLKAEMPGAGAATTQAPQEWLVVTAWQVQTTSFKAQNVADYDDGAQATGAKAADAADGQAGKAGPAGSIAVTRLILRVYPATPAAQAGQAAGKAARQPAATSTQLKTLPSRPSPRPFGAVPFGDGWLVIEL